jgi:hypothetical protein
LPNSDGIGELLKLSPHTLSAFGWPYTFSHSHHGPIDLPCRNFSPFKRSLVARARDNFGAYAGHLGRDFDLGFLVAH